MGVNNMGSLKSRWVFGLGCAAVFLVLGYIGWFFFLLWTHYGGAIFGDPYTYLAFATNLARGNFALKGALAEAVREFYADGTLQLGPIWNTNILPDGTTVYTVAIGFPLVLSQIIRWLGLGVCLHANFLFLLLGFLLIVLVGYEAFGRDHAALWIGLIGLLIFINTRTDLFMRIVYLWREPFFFALILGGALGTGHFLRTGRIWGLLTAAFLFGYAGSVKEANLLYGGAAGLVVLSSHTFRQHERKGRVIAWSIAFGLLGMLPLFVQNYLATGNPLLSLQFARATANYSVDEIGAGLSTGNTRQTLWRYSRLYRNNLYFSWPFWVLFGAGIVRIRKRPLAILLFIFCAIHFGLYSQWGNADYRHMFFAHIPYALLVAAGFVGALQWLGSRIRTPNATWLLPSLAVVVFLISRPLPWTTPLDPQQHFKVADARRMVERMQTVIPSDSVLLSNRVVRDIAAIYGGYEAVRLQDLKGFIPGGNYSEIIDWFLARGTGVYFLDNKDMDPGNYYFPDWTLKDREMLLDHYDLTEVLSLDRETYHMQSMLDRPQLGCWEVQPWSTEEISRDWVVEPPSAFLYLPTRGAEDRIQVRLNGVDIPLEAGGYYYHPVPEDVRNASSVLFEVSALDGVISRYEDARMVNWWENLRHDLGYYGAPSDQEFFPDVDDDSSQPDRTRVLNTPFRMRAPVRCGEDSFTVIGLGVDEISAHLRIADSSGLEWSQPVIRGATWLSLGGEVEAGSRAEIRELTFDVTDAGEGEVHTLHFSRLKAEVCRRRFEIPKSGGCGMILTGILHPALPGGDPVDWSFLLDGKPLQSGTCSLDPRSSRNRFSALITPQESETGILEFRGAGLTEWKWIRVGERLLLEPGAEAAAGVLGAGFFPPETGPEGRYWWMPGEIEIRVPVVAGVQTYRMTLELASGHPAASGDRLLSVQLVGGGSDTIPLPEERETVSVEWSLDQVPQENGMSVIRMSCDSWSPADVMQGSQDRRILGFQLYRMTWVPAEAE